MYSPRTLLPTRAPSAAVPLGMRPGAVSPPHCLQSTPALWDPTKDLRAIASNFCHLENSGRVRNINNQKVTNYNLINELIIIIIIIIIIVVIKKCLALCSLALCNCDYCP